MTDRASCWSDWRERAEVAVRDTGSVTAAMAALAGQVSEARGREGSLVSRWAAVGVEIHFARMIGRGRCEMQPEGVPVVYVNIDSHTSTQQFTIAHEVGHALLNSLDPACLQALSLRVEETLCNDFAQSVILPREALATELAGELPSPRRLLELCGRFDASPSMVLRVLPEHLNLDGAAFLLARLRTHYLRPAVVGFRLDLAAGPERLFWPYEMRIENIGLENLARDGAGAEHGGFFDGADAELRVPLARVDRTTGHNTMVGPARWYAVRQGLKEPYLLARVDCSLLRTARVEKPFQRAFKAAVPAAAEA